MIKYNPKEWFSLIFKFHKSDTFRILLPSMISIAVYAFVIAYLELEVWNLRYKTSTAIHSLLGFVISLLLVFRTNTAYERWWEGRKLWGSLLNNSQNLALKLNAILPEGDASSRQSFHSLISDYAQALKDHLRGESNIENLSEGNKILPSEHVPNKVAAFLFKSVNELHLNKQINGEQLLFVNEQLTSLTDICGACERIKKTPIPFSYSLFLKKFLFVYIMTMPFGFIHDFGYAVIIVMVFVFYVLASLELIAEEIEDPFGKDANDLPIDEITLNIKKSTREILIS